MARKTKAEAEATRHALLDAAEEIFFEKGVSGTSLEQIARRAGMTRGAVYWHFENKISLLEALIERVRLPLGQLLEQLTAKHNLDPLTGLKAVLKEVFHRCEEPRVSRIYTIILYRCEFFDQLSRQCRESEYIDEARQLIEIQMTLAHREGLIRKGIDPHTIAQVVHYSVVGMIKEWLSDPKQFDLSSEGTHMVDHLFSDIVSATV